MVTYKVFFPSTFSEQLIAWFLVASPSIFILLLPTLFLLLYLLRPPFLKGHPSLVHFPYQITCMNERDRETWVWRWRDDWAVKTIALPGTLVKVPSTITCNFTSRESNNLFWLQKSHTHTHGRKGDLRRPPPPTSTLPLSQSFASTVYRYDQV